MDKSQSNLQQTPAKRAEQEQTRRLLEQRERQLNPFQRTTPGSDPGRDGPARGL